MAQMASLGLYIGPYGHLNVRPRAGPTVLARAGGRTCAGMLAGGRAREDSGSWLRTTLMGSAPRYPGPQDYADGVGT